jgi:transcriptional regulator with XRE-family HTH domain
MNIRDQHSKHVAIEPIQVECEMAKKIGVSPTYLSKVERDEVPPPAEDKVRKIA